VSDQPTVSHELLARNATALLLAVKAGDTTAVAGYDALVFPTVFETAQRRGRYIAATDAEKLGSYLPVVRDADLDEVALVAAEMALARARGSALRFDPTRGDGFSWALGALGGAYLDAARNITGTRRMLQVASIEDEQLEQTPAGPTSDPQVTVEARQALEQALAALDDDERYVILAKSQYGFSYREIAELLWGDETRENVVDRLLQTARRKLRVAQRAWVEGQ
jgi:RNA polymerase sigma factor (sigma-70 family)